jgi:hypothetical protein
MYKLQEGVRPTLELLKNAGIKVLNYYPLANEVAKGYSNATVRSSHPCEHSRIDILQWILTTLGTYLVLKKIPKLLKCSKKLVNVMFLE